MFRRFTHVLLVIIALSNFIIICLLGLLVYRLWEPLPLVYAPITVEMTSSDPYNQQLDWWYRYDPPGDLGVDPNIDPGIYLWDDPWQGTSPGILAPFYMPEGLDPSLIDPNDPGCPGEEWGEQEQDWLEEWPVPTGQEHYQPH